MTKVQNFWFDKKYDQVCKILKWLLIGGASEFWKKNQTRKKSLCWKKVEISLVKSGTAGYYLNTFSDLHWKASFRVNMKYFYGSSLNKTCFKYISWLCYRTVHLSNIFVEKEWRKRKSVQNQVWFEKIENMLSRSRTARGSSNGLVTVGSTKVKSHVVSYLKQQ